MSFYTSLTGLKAATTELGVTSNNIANAGTSGFKKSSADFGDIMASSPQSNGSTAVGAGVALNEIRQEFSQGNLEFTANSLDLAITGDGFFTLGTPDGSRIYTRNGGFMLNDQNQIVNAAGQTLMAVPVDSTNKADFSQPMAALNIPRKTSSEFTATSKIEMGLNLPADTKPITATFNREKPDTYHKKASITVYGASGSPQVATIYYVRTEAPTADQPYSKWQTHVFIDDKEVKPALSQASDGNDGYYINKYGEIKTRSELLELQRTSPNADQYLIPTNTPYQKINFDDLGKPRESIPATINTQIDQASPFVDNLNLSNGQQGVDFSALTRAELTNMFQISVDGSAHVDVGLEHLAGKNLKLSGTELAFELTNQLNAAFGDGRKFSFASADSELLEIRRIPDINNPASIQTLALDIKAIVAAQEATDGVTLMTADQIAPEALAYSINQYLATQPGFDDLEVAYDFASQGLKIVQTDPTNVTGVYLSHGGAGTNSVFGLSPADTGGTPPYYGKQMTAVNGDDATVLFGGLLPNGGQIQSAANQRYGITVTFEDGGFVVRSGQTGDASSLDIRLNFDTGTPPAATPASAIAADLLGIPLAGATVASQTSELKNLPPLRGQASTPAQIKGKPMGVDTSKTFTVTSVNNRMSVIVDGISSQIELTPGQYKIANFTQHLQDRINLMADDLGRSVSGVKVAFDSATKTLKITGATASENSFLQVNGHSDWGLEGMYPGFGTTSTYVSYAQATENDRPVYVSQDSNGNWTETTLKGSFNDDDLPYWQPVFLDRGELTFDASGALLFPSAVTKLESKDATGTALSVNFSKSTQYSNPFTVFSQSQDGKPEGDLIGISIGEDGLVSASYSNGSQQSLGKVVIANFAVPQGLRQIGNSSYYASGTSGEPNYGEAGTASFGVLRAGARERSNVDLTAELVDLITAQRNFQANAKAIETTASMTQSIINIRS